MIYMERLLYNIWFKLWFESFDNSLSYLWLTTYEISHARAKPSYLKAFFWFLLGAVMTPIGVAIYTIWFILFRKLLRSENFQKSFIENKTNDISAKLKNFSSVNTTFEILSVNVCLLPDSFSRENNLCFTPDRLESIGNLINKSAPNTLCFSKFATSVDKSKQFDFNNWSVKRDEINPGTDMKVEVIDDFVEGTDIDFVCMQEVWTIDTALKLKKFLHEKYPYIIYDAGTKNFSSNKNIGFESGLLIASRYPIVEVDFKQFTTKSGLCAYTSKGLLITKVN